eukprot:scaffold154_cov185-Alexandrium_tamarense.AAC.17
MVMGGAREGMNGKRRASSGVTCTDRTSLARQFIGRECGVDWNRRRCSAAKLSKLMDGLWN